MNPFEKISEWVQEHPYNGYLIAAGLLLFWLVSLILGWKWTWQTSSWNENFLRETLGDAMYRICIGVVLAVVLALVLYLYFSARKMTL